VRGLLIYGLYRLLGALTGPLPPRIGYGLARPAGALLFALSPRMRRALIHNMRRVLGPDADEAEVRTTARRACVNVARGHYDLFRVSRLNVAEIQAMTHVEGLEHMQAALAQGKGAILVTAHFGNVDIMGQVPLAYGIPFSGPVQHVQNERLFQYTQKLRQSHGLRLIPADGPLMGLIRALKRGEIIGLPCDRDIADNTRIVEFFGAPARLPHGPVRLALRTGAPLVPAFSRRLPDDTFLVQVEPALDLPDSGDREADVLAGMQMIVEVMERHISRAPEQWLVSRPVWSMEE